MDFPISEHVFHSVLPRTFSRGVRALPLRATHWTHLATPPDRVEEGGEAFDSGPAQRGGALSPGAARPGARVGEVGEGGYRAVPGVRRPPAGGRRGRRLRPPRPPVPRPGPRRGTNRGRCGVRWDQRLIAITFPVEGNDVIGFSPLFPAFARPTISAHFIHLNLNLTVCTLRKTMCSNFPAYS